MSAGPWNDDEMEPLAPLPPHERGWRHPSEVGQQHWQLSEPPIAIGRGLAAATGLFGGLLGLTLVMTILPARSGGSAVASVRSTVTEIPVASTANSTQPPPDDSAPRDDDATPTTAPLAPASPADLEQQPDSQLRTLPTYQLHHGTDLAVAVVISTPAGRVVLTTANAVRSDHTVDLVAADGSVTSVAVLFVDQRSGLAILSPRAARVATPFVLADAVQPGDMLTFVGDRSIEIEVASDGSIAHHWQVDPAIHEGTPVVNDAGELVAVCTHRDGMQQLIGIDTLDAIQQALAAYRAASPVWVGIGVADDQSGDLRITSVEANSPAAAAGLEIGDRITAVDGVIVADLLDLTAVLAELSPGTRVEFRITHADDITDRVTITLAEPHHSV